MPAGELEDRVLIVAPTGGDAVNAEAVLAQGGFPGLICADLRVAGSEFAQGGGALLVAEEALTGASFEYFVARLGAQPSWSDLPVIVITRGGDTTYASNHAYEAFGPLTNLTLVERPFRVVTLLATIRTALRARQRQYQMRELLEQLERKVRERTVRLQQTVNDLETFSYSVSHDLRAPLRAMHGYSGALLEDYGDRLDQPARDYIKRIMNASTRLDRLVQDLLTYSRTAAQKIEFREIELAGLIEELIDQYPAFQPPNAQIVLVKPLLPIRAHEPSLVQCLSNLLANAVKFVPAGQKAAVRVWTEPAAGQVRLLVRDNGIGIHRDHYERIFKMFERLSADGEYEGTGVGLAIVAKSVERMGGRVGVESVLGEGSTFWLELPLAKGTA